MNRLNKMSAVLIAAAAAGFLSGAARAAIVIQPDESASKDVFVYQGIPDSNFDTGFGGAFQPYLSTGNTNGSGHDTKTLIQFDLSSVSLTPAQVASATLRLYVIPTETVGFGDSPSSANPVQVEAAPVTGSWTEGDVTWNSAPTAGTPGSPVTINGTDQWISIDITTVVQSWLNGTINDGLLLTQPDVVTGGTTIALYDSASATDGNLPYLEITAVPEPASAALFGAGLLLVAARRGRGRMA